MWVTGQHDRQASTPSMWWPVSHASAAAPWGALTCSPLSCTCQGSQWSWDGSERGLHSTRSYSAVLAVGLRAAGGTSQGSLVSAVEESVAGSGAQGKDGRAARGPRHGSQHSALTAPLLLITTLRVGVPIYTEANETELRSHGW